MEIKDIKIEALNLWMDFEDKYFSFDVLNIDINSNRYSLFSIGYWTIIGWSFDILFLQYLYHAIKLNKAKKKKKRNK